MSTDPPPTGPPPVRLVAREGPTGFAPGRPTVLARVAGDGLRALDVRDGDEVVLVRGARAEHGDLAAILDADGRACLWKVYPEGDRLRLSLGHPAFDRHTGPSPRVHGVVVAVRRRLPRRPPPASGEDEPPAADPGPAPEPCRERERTRAPTGRIG